VESLFCRVGLQKGEKTMGQCIPIEHK
jgi:hypothetical protein